MNPAQDPKQTTTTIAHEEQEGQGAFVIARGGRGLAAMTYTVTDNSTITIDHTEVSEELRGTGTGARLVEAAVQWARSAGKKIIPVCPFAKSVFDKRPDYHDVLANTPA